MPMKLTSITISERPEWERKKDGAMYAAKCTIRGEHPYNAGITIDIPDEQLSPIVDIMQRLVAENMAASAAAFAADVQASIGGAVIEQRALGERADGGKDDGPTAA